MALIKAGAIAPDNWLLLDATAAIPATGRVIAPLAGWLAARASLSPHRDPLGVWLDGDVAIEPIGAALAALPLVAIRFPKLADGRGFSTGRLLRERYGFAGELRAIGEIVPDQLWELARCGFDAFVVRDAQAAAAITALGAFGDAYQSSAAQPLPLFRRRNGGPAARSAPSRGLPDSPDAPRGWR
jgi:uncharacterized protein (DUF934 family)